MRMQIFAEKGDKFNVQKSSVSVSSKREIRKEEMLEYKFKPVNPSKFSYAMYIALGRHLISLTLLFTHL